jgi:prepilin-type N-terminal cleavage/methylation domain-containing protein/prepilin-type processing-associated H-X9-DG protein
MKHIRHENSTAFTLIELLVVIAIIGILAALLLSALSSAKNRAVQMTCVSNYRQVGVALHMYLDESSDQLPPGNNPSAPNYLDLTEMSAYNANSTNYISYYLANDLSATAPQQVGLTALNVLKVLACPGYRAPNGYNPESDNFTHAFSFTLTRLNNPPLDKLPGFPFGRKSAGQQALKLSEISTAAPLSDVWVLADLDLQSIAGDFGGKEDYIAIKPAHVTGRNYLFFDSHVSSKKVDGWENF